MAGLPGSVYSYRPTIDNIIEEGLTQEQENIVKNILFNKEGKLKPGLKLAYNKFKEKTGKTLEGC